MFGPVAFAALLFPHKATDQNGEIRRPRSGRYRLPRCHVESIVLVRPTPPTGANKLFRFLLGIP